jgi:hypothetical protein
MVDGKLFLVNPKLLPKNLAGRIPSLIRGGDLAGMLEKGYSGDLSTRSPAVKTHQDRLFSGWQ